MTQDMMTTLVTQGTDGVPHLTYFDRKHQLSFVWDGGEGEWVDVSYGGYGEPVIARIPCPVLASPTPITKVFPIAEVLVYFERTCIEFIELIHEIERTDIDHAKEPRG